MQHSSSLQGALLLAQESVVGQESFPFRLLVQPLEILPLIKITAATQLNLWNSQRGHLFFLVILHLERRVLCLQWQLMEVKMEVKMAVQVKCWAAFISSWVVVVA